MINSRTSTYDIAVLNNLQELKGLCALHLGLHINLNISGYRQYIAHFRIIDLQFDNWSSGYKDFPLLVGGDRVDWRSRIW